MTTLDRGSRSRQRMRMEFRSLMSAATVPSLALLRARHSICKRRVPTVRQLSAPSTMAILEPDQSPRSICGKCAASGVELQQPLTRAISPPMSMIPGRSAGALPSTPACAGKKSSSTGRTSNMSSTTTGPRASASISIPGLMAKPRSTSTGAGTPRVCLRTRQFAS